MKRASILFITGILVATLAACGRGEGGAAGYGAGGGKSLREGSTAPYHSDIAQDETYQTLLGLNILLYPGPVDDAKFEPFGKPHWDLVPSDFVATMRDIFDKEMGEQAVYEPIVEPLQGHPLIAKIQGAIYDGEPIQVGWIYGNNDSLGFLEYDDATVTLISAEPVILFVGEKDKIDTEKWTYSTKDAEGFYIPENSVIELYPGTLHSMPVRVLKKTGQLTAIVTPKGLGLEKVSPGVGMDQALVATGRWIFALPDNSQGYYAGLTGKSISIEPADSSTRY